MEEKKTVVKHKTAGNYRSGPSIPSRRPRTTDSVPQRVTDGTDGGGWCTNPGSGWDRHSSVPPGPGIRWTPRIANSCSNSEHTATGGAVSGRRYMVSSSSSSIVVVVVVVLFVVVVVVNSRCRSGLGSSYIRASTSKETSNEKVIVVV